MSSTRRRPAWPMLLSAVVAAAWVLPAALASYRVVHPARYVPREDRLKGETVKLEATDGLSLVGRWRPAAKPAGTVVLLHAYGVSKNQMAPMADFLHTAGFNTLAYDARAHGESPGSGTTIGAREQADLGKVLDWLGKKGITSRIGALGISMGAATSLFRAAEDRRIQAVVAEGCFSTMPKLMAASFPFFFHLPNVPYAPLATRFASWQMGVALDSLRPIDAIARLGTRPVFVIGGMKDAIATPDQTMELAQHYVHGQLWLVPEATHCRAWKAAKTEYASRVSNFFQAALASELAVVPAPALLAGRP